VTGNELEISRLLIEHGANVIAKGREGETPLQLVTGLGYAEVIALLRESGAE